MNCGHDTMIGRIIIAEISDTGNITKGKGYKVIDELWRNKAEYDLKRVTVVSDSGANYDLIEGEFS